MDSDQDLLDEHNAREDAFQAAEWKLKKASQQRYEDAAKKAHAYRNTARLVGGGNLQLLQWEGMALSSQMHLIADAKNVAENPTITAIELNRLYKERLIARGDTDSSDLGDGDESTPVLQAIEEQVLECLKKCLATPSITPTEFDTGPSQ